MRKEYDMPEEETIERAREDKREGKSPSTQAGEFVREEMEHIRKGEHGARSAKQAIAIGLSKARRAGVKLPPPEPGKTSSRTQRQAERDLAKGRGGRRKPSRTRSRDEARAQAGGPFGCFTWRTVSSGAQRGTLPRSAAAKKTGRTRKRRRG
jgi:Family of unknown function (DUF6496)